ncbi:unnamed protein product [Peniophora sp. CBMAI 1063]|nr:unnamed protein product [Peniophora sp. CBMAI 1063]
MSGDRLTPWSSSVDTRLSESTLQHGSRQRRPEALDSELDDIHEVFRRARRILHNLSAGPCALPSEVLAYIFECLQPDWEPWADRWSEDNPVFHSGWMCITHVCGLWRKVALGVPSLWSKPTINVLSINHQYIPDILLRSRTQPLDLEVDLCDMEDGIAQDPGLNAWLSPAVLRHTRRLTLATNMDLITYAASSFSENSERHFLTDLDVTTSDDSGNVDLPLPIRSLGNLSRLILCDCRIPWRQPLLTSLNMTHLELYGLRQHRPSYQDVASLAGLSSLQVLELWDVVPYVDPGMNGQLPPIVLAGSLRRLRIHAVEQELGLDGLKFISCFHTPPGTSCEYVVAGAIRLVSEESIVDDICKRLLSILSFAGIESVEAHEMDMSRRRLRLVSNTQSIVNIFKISRFRRLHPMRGFYMVLYLPAIAIERLHTLSIDVYIAYIIKARALWSELLRAGGVRRLGFIKAKFQPSILDFGVLLKALCHYRTVDPSSDTDELLPHLETLAIPFGNDAAAHADLIATLIDLVQTRQAKGRPLRELIIPREADHWTLWSTLRSVITITPICYPVEDSPLTPDSFHSSTT